MKSKTRTAFISGVAVTLLVGISFSYISRNPLPEALTVGAQAAAVDPDLVQFFRSGKETLADGTTARYIVAVSDPFLDLENPGQLVRLISIAFSIRDGNCIKTEAYTAGKVGLASSDEHGIGMGIGSSSYKIIASPVAPLTWSEVLLKEQVGVAIGGP